jgi:hypothetical protein
VNPRVEELLIERALRPLDERERAELEQLSAHDDGSFDAAAAAVVLATTPIEPMPAHLANKILAAAPKPDLTRTLAGVVASPVLPRDTIVGVEIASFAPPKDELAVRRKRRVIVPWLAAAACLLVAAGAVWIAARKGGVVSASEARADLLASVKPLAWTATPDPNARGASGDVVWSTTEQRGYMRFVGLAPNDPKQFQYQLWIFDKDRDDKFPVDGGVFDVSSTGEIIVPIAAKLHVTDATLFAVTIEKPGGVVVSKRERIVVTAAKS